MRDHDNHSAIDMVVAIALGALLAFALDAWLSVDEFPIHAPELIEVDLPAAQLRVMT